MVYGTYDDFRIQMGFCQNVPVFIFYIKCASQNQANIPTYQLLSVGYTILLLTLGFMEFKSKKVKG